MEDLFQLISELPVETRTLLAELLLRSTPGITPPSERSPVAIIGIGCRFPGGADDPATFWTLLREGVDAVREVPPDRWDIDAFYDPDPAIPGRMCTRRGGFLNDVYGFDPGFFGISPREALTMDPQQRLLLEVACEALDDAGQPADRLAGSRTGVFIGASSGDFPRLLQFDRASRLQRFDTFAATGSSTSVIANRVSYLLNLRGPSLTVDTACSSSLVAVHLACQSLWRSECDLALAGGVNLMLLPATTVLLNRFLSPDGRCHAFDARANGFVRGEGAGVVVLKRLELALDDRDPIYALIRGSAVNQDGYCSGLTVPNGGAQRAVLREAIASAGIHPAEVGYLEAHGTGTALGDPIEAAALGEVLGQGRPAGERCAIGSVKTNLGHLEAAAGIAGLIKAALALRHLELPPSLHFEKANPDIPFADLPLQVQRSHAAWETGGRPAYAGVSSFGFGGTNAHVVLGQAPTRALDPEVAQAGDSELLLLSAHTPEGLQALAGRYRTHLHGLAEAFTPRGLCRTAATRRQHHAHRLSIVGTSPETFSNRLDAFLRDEAGSGLATGVKLPGPPRRVLFVFSGQGPQRAGMGLELMEREPVFRDVMTRCDALLEPMTGWSLLEVLASDGADARLSRTEVAQPAVFAVQLALAALMRSWGIVPSAVIGHSIGEVAAAQVAGALSLEEALRVVFHRGRLMASAAGQGGMASVALSPAEVGEFLAELGNGVEVAAVNNPSTTVISGAAGPLTAALEALNARGVNYRRLDVDYAFHSREMAPVQEALEQALGALTPVPLELPMFSTTTGAAIDGPALGGLYWARNVREPVRFEAAVGAALEAGYDLFLELSPHPVLTSPLREWLTRDRRAAAVSTLRRGRSERTAMLEMLGTLYAQGVDIRWPAVYPERGVCVPLPAYPWQRQPFRSDALEITHPSAAGQSIPSGYYDAVSGATVSALQDTFEESYLIFAPFPEVIPGFSWAVTYARPNEHPEHFHAMLRAQKEMKAVLFRHVDFAACRRVLDYGCGYATDLITLVERHPHLEAVGFSISAAQIEIGRTKVSTRRLQERVRLECHDSAHTPFPGRFDLAFGFEVTHHIKDKAALLANLGEHLNDRGMLVVADFISNAEFSIDHDETSSYLITREQWIELLSAQGLQLIECVDVSREIANFLDDPQLDQHLAGLGRSATDQNIRSAARSYDQLCRLLRRGLASYMLLVARKEGGAGAQLEALNRERLASLVRYQDVASSRWLYEPRWISAEDVWTGSERPRIAAGQARRGPWLLLADRGGVAESMASLLGSRGERCLLASPGGSFSREEDRFTVDPGEPGHFQALFDSLGGQAPRAVVHLWGAGPAWTLSAPEPGEEGQLQAACASICGGALYLVQTMAKRGWTESPRVWLVTRGAQPAGAAKGDLSGLAGAPLWGFGRTLALEHPELWGGLVDLDSAPMTDEAQRLLDEISRPDGEDQVALRGAERLVLRLARCVPPPVGTPGTLKLRSDATYLVTGGLGALGLEVAGWMLSRGARHLVLVGRREPDAWAAAALSRLERVGVRIQVRRADVSDRAELRALLADLPAELPLRGVVHAAGLLDDGLIRDQSWRRFDRVFSPKLAGAWNLHEETLERSLDFFVLFSAGAGLVGSAGQAGYTAANTFLDALAHYRRAAGLPALAIDWGLWSGRGMGAALRPQDLSRWMARGIDLMLPEQALQAMELLMLAAGPQAAILPICWPRMLAAHPSGQLPLVFADLAREPQGSAGTGSIVSVPRFLQQLGEHFPSERQEFLTEHVRGQIARTLGLDPATRIHPQKPLMDLGFDSLMAVELRNALSQALGRVLPPTLLFDYPTLAALATFLGREVLEIEQTASVALLAQDRATMIQGGSHGDPLGLEVLLDGVEELCEAEAEALLAKRLSESGG